MNLHFRDRGEARLGEAWLGVAWHGEARQG